MIETEIKFAVSPETANKLLASAPVKRLQPTTKRVVSTYYDTRQHLFRKVGGALRVRKKAGRFEQTIKLPANGPLGMQNHEEYNVALPSETPDLSQFDAALISRFSLRQNRIRLLPQFTSDIRRTTAVFRSRKTSFEMAVDTGELYSHGTRVRREPVCEIEFELQAGDPLVMLDRVAALAERFDLSPLHLTKAARGYALARPSLRAAPQKAGKVELPPDLDVGDAFQYIVGHALEQLFANRAPTLAGEPGGIHQSRVAIRRIRAALRAFKQVLPYDKRKAFNGEFRWLQGRLGPARDWHVFLDETMPALLADDVDADYRALQRVAKAERRRTTSEAIEILESRRYTRLILQFQRWMLSLAQEDTSDMHGSLREFATGVFTKTRKDLLQDPRPLSRFSPEERHTVRKRGKKARYATEFFAHLWEPQQTSSYLTAMEALQDQLGQANDATTARFLMAAIPLHTVPAETIVAVGHWSERRIRQCIRTGQPLWRKLQRVPPFWH